MRHRRQGGWGLEGKGERTIAVGHVQACRGAMRGGAVDAVGANVLLRKFCGYIARVHTCVCVCACACMCTHQHTYTHTHTHTRHCVSLSLSLSLTSLRALCVIVRLCTCGRASGRARVRNDRMISMVSWSAGNCKRARRDATSKSAWSRRRMHVAACGGE